MKKGVSVLSLLIVLVLGGYFVYPYVIEYINSMSVEEQDHYVADTIDDTTKGDEQEGSLNKLLDTLVQQRSPAEESLERVKKNLQDEALEIDLLTQFDTEEPIHLVYKELVQGYHTRRATGQTIDALLPIESGIPRHIMITVTEAETGTPIPGATVFLWGAIVGNTDDTGQLSIERMIPRSHDVMLFESHKMGYSRAFKRFNALYHDGAGITIDLTMHSATSRVVKTHTDDISITSEDMDLAVAGDCVLVSDDGSCYEGEVYVEYNYIAPDQVDVTTGIPMEALVDGEVKYLISNGMAFTDFYADDSTLLLYNNGDAQLCYKLGEDQIQARQERYTVGPSLDGYWWFDRSIGYWKYDEHAVVTIEDDRFCVETKHIY